MNEFQLVDDHRELLLVLPKLCENQIACRIQTTVTRTPRYQ
jgi:hypothetical protein